MKPSNATDVPNLIFHFSPRIPAVFNPCNFLGVMFFAPSGQKPSLTTFVTRHPSLITRSRHGNVLIQGARHLCRFTVPWHLCAEAD
jgi:hypothetical protein